MDLADKCMLVMACVDCAPFPASLKKNRTELLDLAQETTSPNNISFFYDKLVVTIDELVFASFWNKNSVTFCFIVFLLYFYGIFVVFISLFTKKPILGVCNKD